MKKVDNIKNSAYMVLSDLAFIFAKDEGMRRLIVYNVKNISQMAIFNIMNDGRFLLNSSDLSETNTYKAIALIERNKMDLIEGYKLWESTQKNA